MDGSRFDTLTRRLAAPRSRRALLGLLAIGGLSVAETEAKPTADRHVRSQGNRHRHDKSFLCKPAGAKCINTPKKGSKPPRSRLCKACCETFRKVTKKVGVCCIATGQPCSSDAECCLGTCSVGHCQNTSFLPPGSCLELFAACTSAAECCPLVGVGDTCPTSDLVCAPIQSQKGARTCGTAGGGGAVCCKPNCGSCSDDCECCGDQRCRNGLCQPPPPCHQLGEACTDGEPCCGGAGTCDGSFCCLADGATCPCQEPGQCQGCCSGICGEGGQCGTCVPYAGTCTSAADCCANVPCNGGLCRFN